MSGRDPVARLRDLIARRTARRAFNAARRSGTYATLPIREMDEFARLLGEHAGPIRARALYLTGESLLSEAQIEAPVRTGTLKSSHVLDESEPDAVVIGVNTSYALAVHETHPTRRRWFLESIRRHFRRTSRKALETALEEAGR